MKRSRFSLLLWLFPILTFREYIYPLQKNLQNSLFPCLQNQNCHALITLQLHWNIQRCDPTHFKPWKQLNYVEIVTCWYHNFHFKIIYLFLECYVQILITTWMPYGQKQPSHFKNWPSWIKQLVRIKIDELSINVSQKFFIKEYAP